MPQRYSYDYAVSFEAEEVDEEKVKKAITSALDQFEAKNVSVTETDQTELEEEDDNES